MNKVIELGRITADPEIRYTQGAKTTAIANFSIAVNRKFKREGQPEADFFNCTAFGKVAEVIEKYFFKGSKILVTGSLQNDSFEKDGQKRTVTKIMVEEVDFVDSKAANNDAPKASNNEGFMNMPTGIEDELPFA